MKKRILVCGGRDFEDYDFVEKTLNNCKKWFDKEFCIIHGSARGADRCAHIWAFYEGCPVIEMKANWDKYNKNAGSIRNEWMLNFAFPDLIIAFPGGKGTAHMIKIARKAGKDVYIPEYIYES